MGVFREEPGDDFLSKPVFFMRCVVAVAQGKVSLLPTKEHVFLPGAVMCSASQSTSDNRFRTNCLCHRLLVFSHPFTQMSVLSWHVHSQSIVMYGQNIAQSFSAASAKGVPGERQPGGQRRLSAR